VLAMTTLPRRFDATFPNEPALEAATRIVRILRDDGHDAYFVGGCVRDALLGRSVKDYDVATGAPPSRVEKLFHHTIPVGESFGVMMVVEGGHPFEVATFRSESGYANRRHPSNVDFSTADKDVLRRDFTINGLFYDPLAGEGIDLVGGVADLEARILRTIGAPADRFDEDALRLMRGVRFAATFGFAFDPATWEALAERAQHLSEISAERIGEEWGKGLRQSEPTAYLELMRRSGIMAVTLPALAALQGVSVAGMSALEATAQRLEHLHAATGLDDEMREAALWAGLFFEVGRPEATKRREQGLWLGEAMMQPALEHWRAAAKGLALGNKRRDTVLGCLERAHEWQMFDNLARWRQRELLGGPCGAVDRALLGAFAAVYRTSSIPLDSAAALQAELNERGEAMLPPPLLDGRDLMRELGLKPGPVLGERLSRLRRLQLDGALENRAAALAAAREWDVDEKSM